LCASTCSRRGPLQHAGVGAVGADDLDAEGRPLWSTPQGSAAEHASAKVGTYVMASQRM
jgi:hypothetical protein